MKLLFILILSAISLSALSQKEISLGEVASHVGDSVTVSGKIDGVKVFVDDDKKPTRVLLNLGGAYPNQILTIVVDPSYAMDGKIMPGETAKGSTAKAMGTIVVYKGKPQIVVSSPKQLHIIEATQ
jgi:hypothetical protein